MTKKYEFKGTLLEEFKKALKGLADHAPDMPMMVDNGKAYSFKQLYEEVAQETDYGRRYISMIEELCNLSEEYTPADLFTQISRDIQYLKDAKEKGISPFDIH